MIAATFVLNALTLALLGYACWQQARTRRLLLGDRRRDEDPRRVSRLPRLHVDNPPGGRIES